MLPKMKGAPNDAPVHFAVAKLMGAGPRPKFVYVRPVVIPVSLGEDGPRSQHQRGEPIRWKSANFEN